MAKNSSDELQKHTLNLRAGDMEKLSHLFPTSQPSVVVRKIVSSFIDKTSRTAQARTPSVELD